jgi:hypothetical protein
LRSLQDDSEGSAQQFSTWTSDYLWLSGRLLRDGTNGEDDLALAFAITERMRGRSLLDTLERARTPLDAKSPAAQSRRELLEGIAAVQRRLMNPELADGERRRLLEQLQDLELREGDARRQIGLALPRQDGSAPSFADLRALQSTLRPNEALLSFQVGLWETFEKEFGGGAWLIALTSGQRTLHRLPDRAQLAPMVPVFTGLLARTDGLAGPSAARLYEVLLADAIRLFPPGIERLIVIPDGPLHHLPFDALRDGRDGVPLATRYELVVAPSATLWRHWRQKAQTPSTHKALAFADPVLDARASSPGVAGAERSATLERGVRLARLPYARRESRSIARHLGGAETLLGSWASERALKERNLRDYDILHFAAHAIADEGRPERSAVLLAPGADNEDGLLQTREIEGLDLDGRVVVLSACETASGTILNGEGMLSLARAFFAAGAKTVIGTRWPIRDHDAAALFDVFYQRLGEGASLSEALRQAKTQAVDAQQPAAAWASVVLLGDGDFRPFPGGRPRPPATSGVSPSLVVLLVLPLAALAWRLARRSAPPSAS